MDGIPIGEFRNRIDRLYSTGRHAPSTRGRMLQVLDELSYLHLDQSPALAEHCRAIGYHRAAG